jgi:hypothetical protein
MEDDHKPTVEAQMRLNPNLKEVVWNEIHKLLDARIIYPISDIKWVSPVHVVPKKGGTTVMKSEDGALISTRMVTGWRMCIDYKKLNSTTRNDHFLLHFIDQMLYVKMVQMNINFTAFTTQATQHMHNMYGWMSDIDRRVHDVWHLTEHINNWHINCGDYQQPTFPPYPVDQWWFIQAPPAPHEGYEPPPSD